MPRSLFSERYDHFRALLVTARQEAGVTQVQLAAKLTRPQSFVSKFERGERRLDLVEFLEIAEALGIDPSDFLKKLQPKRHAARASRK